MNSTSQESLRKLINYIEKENYKGYDPYDTLNSFLPFSKFGKWIPAIAIQFQKRNPFNIRRLLGVKKGYNPKGMGLMLKAYCLLYQKSGNFKYKKQADYLFTWLKNNYSMNYSGFAWGYNFDWANPQSNLKAYTPSIVVTSFVIDGIMKYYEIFSCQEAKKIIISSADFIINDLPITKLEKGISIGYTQFDEEYCYNASLLGAETLAKAYYLTNEERYKTLARDSVLYVLSKQKSNGCWYYSYNPKSKSERKQIDFHQGFVLISLSNYQLYSEDNDSIINNAISRGLKFYKEKQFFDNGKSLWRLPKVWPVDIHNQAQGIITFAMLQRHDNSYLNFARKIMDYTIKYMQNSEEGYYYYKKHSRYTNKIPYMRWSQAWMLLAHSILQNAETKDTQNVE